MLDPAEVQAEMATGLAFTCAMCLVYWRAKNAQVFKTDEVRCPEQACGGPMTGKSFPKYEGPLVGHRVHVCFRCGRESTSGLKFPECDEIIGVCRGCLDEVHLWRRASRRRDYATLDERRIETRR